MRLRDTRLTRITRRIEINFVVESAVDSHRYSKLDAVTAAVRVNLNRWITLLAFAMRNSLSRKEMRLRFSSTSPLSKCPMSLRFESISPIIRQRLPVQRSVCNVSGQPLVLFHKRGNSLIDERKPDYLELVEKLGLGPVVEIQDEGWQWCNSDPRDFNCHAVAIGSGVGLTPNDWLEGSASSSTLNVNPAQVLLDAYFVECIDLKDNDIFVLRDSKTGNLSHSGFIRIVDGVSWAVSKFGEGPICVTTFEMVSAVFEGSFDEVRWYRQTKHPLAQSYAGNGFGFLHTRLREVEKESEHSSYVPSWVHYTEVSEESVCGFANRTKSSDSVNQIQSQ